MNNKYSFFPVFLMVWSLTIVVAFILNVYILQNHSEELVKRRAEDFYNIMLSSIQRDIENGFVYVPITELTQPSPYLEHLPRDIITSSGDVLTLLNPATMTHRLLEHANKYNISVIRLTSLDPLNPEYGPDEWEIKALQTLTDKNSRYFEKIKKDNMTVFRYMTPLVIEQSCISCHAPQNVKIGDVRGGISIDTEFEGVYLMHFNNLPERLLIIYSLIFLVGIFLLIYFWAAINRRKLEMEEKTQDLQNLNVAKDKFTSIMAHDLRTPAANIKSLSEILINDYDDFNEDERKKCMEMLIESAKTHCEMLDSLLELSMSRLGNKEYNPVRLEICKLINTVLEQTKLQAEQKQIKQKNHASEYYVNVDKNMISTVIRNLVVNAIKFTYPGGEVVIRTEKKNENVIISVADNGIGISDSRKERIFRVEGSRSTTGTANEKGTGLGLLLCKEYVEHNGGRIWLESEIDKGTTFYFTLLIV